MTFIHDTNAPTQNLRVPDIVEETDDGEEEVVHAMSEKYREEGVDIPESDAVEEGGVTQVDAETAAVLVEQCPTISYHEPDSDADDHEEGV